MVQLDIANTAQYPLTSVSMGQCRIQTLRYGGGVGGAVSQKNFFSSLGLSLV